MVDKKVEEFASEAQAYSPGLKVKRSIVVRRTRRLPMRGTILVKLGDNVDYKTTVAEVKMPGKPTLLNAANLLTVENEEVAKYLCKKVGDPVKEGEVIAKCVSMFGLIKKFVYSPIDGFVDDISAATGRITVRTPPESVSIDAYLPGTVVSVMEGEGAVIETRAAMIQGIFGVGGETHGKLVVAVKSSEDDLPPEAILPEYRDCILVAGGLVTSEALKKAVEVGVRGIISGGICEADLTAFIGHSIGVAITGEEEVGVTLIITEGFGKIMMSRRTFNLLKAFEGRVAHINGATQIRAGVQRPEIIIPNNEASSGDSDDVLTMRPGTPVRIIQTPNFGDLGVVVSLPINLRKVETEADVRVVNVKLHDGSVITLPRANVEIIEE